MSEEGPGREPDSTHDAEDGHDRPGRDRPSDGGGPREGTARVDSPSRGPAEPRSEDDPRGRGEPDESRAGAGASGDGALTAAGGGDGPVQAVEAPPEAGADDVPEDVRTYDRFTKVDRASYDRVNEFLRERTYVTAREWAIARLCADFRTATGVEMTKIGNHLPELVPFMTDTYSAQAVNQARSAFERKVRMAGATFLYGAMSGFFTADELDELMYEVTEVAKFLLEVEGVELAVEEELDAEDRISAVMREVRAASEELRYDEVACPHCGQGFRPDAGED